MIKIFKRVRDLEVEVKRLKETNWKHEHAIQDLKYALNEVADAAGLVYQHRSFIEGGWKKRDEA